MEDNKDMGLGGKTPTQRTTGAETTAATGLMTKEFTTAWGSTLAELGTADLTTGDMPAEMENVGVIDEDSLTFTTDAGTEYTLTDINGELIDNLNKQPKITITLNIQSPTLEKMAKFWEIEEDATKKIAWVKSMVTTANMAFRMSNKDAYGSMAINVPRASVTLIPGWEVAKGWVFAMTFVVLKSKKGLIGFSEVVAPTIPA